MGTIKLPTYESHIPTQYPGAEPRPDLEGMARLGQAQNNFFSTLFGAGQFAVKLYAQAQAEKSAGTRNQAVTAYLNREGDNVRLIEQKPVSSDDPLLKDANDDQRNLPNLYLLDKQNQTARDEIVSTLTDDADKEWFVQWQAQHDASTRKVVGEWDIGIQKGLFMDRTSKQLQDMIALRNIPGADRIIDNIPSGDVNRDEMKELVRKDIAKGMLLKAAVSMGDAGAAFLADPSKLRYPGLNGEARDMPAADVEDLQKHYKEGLAWDEAQAQAFNATKNTELANAFKALASGDSRQPHLTYDMIQGFQGKQAAQHIEHWTDVLRSFESSQRSGGGENKEVSSMLAGAMSYWRQGKLTSDEMRRLLRSGLAGGMNPNDFNEWDKELNVAPKSDPSSSDAFTIIDSGTKKEADGKVLYDLPTAGKLAAKLQQYIKQNPNSPDKWVQYASNLKDAEAKQTAIGRVQTVITGQVIPANILASQAGLKQIGQGEAISELKDAAGLQFSIQQGKLMGIWKDNPEYKTNLLVLSDLGAKKLAAMMKVPVDKVRRDVDENGQTTFGVPTGRASNDFRSYRWQSDGKSLWMERLTNGVWAKVE